MLAAAVVPAQGETATAGRVLDEQHRPVVGATVHIIGAEPPLEDRFEPAHRVEVETDEKGRFVVQLRARHEYCAWAVGPVREGGARGVSEEHEVLPGDGFELTLGALREPTRLEVRGRDAWRDVAAVHVEVAVDVRFTTWQRCEATAPIELPFGPERVGWQVALCDDRGRIVHSRRLRPGYRPPVYEVPPPRRLDVLVRDEGSVAIAGAELLIGAGHRGSWRFGGRPQLWRWRVIGTTGADGRASLMVPSVGPPLVRDPEFPDGPSSILLFARSRGYRAALGGWCGRLLVDGQTFHNRTFESPLTFTLKKGRGVHGALTAEGRQGLADVPIELVGQLEVLPAADGAIVGATQRIPIAFCATTATDGSFSMDHVPDGLRDARVLIGPSPATPSVAMALRETQLAEPLRLSLDAARHVELRGVDAHGQPIRNGQVVMVPLPFPDWGLDATTYRTRLDDRGAVRVPMEPGPWAVFVFDHRLFGWARFDPENDRSLRVRGDELPVVHGRAVDASGGPVAGAWLRLSQTYRRGTGDADERILASIAPSLISRWLDRTHVDEHGRFAFPLLETASRYTFTVKAVDCFDGRFERNAFDGHGDVGEIVLRRR